MGADMTGSWRAWEGRTVDGKFVLGGYLGGSDGSGVFRTRVGDGADAAIRLTALDGAEAEGQQRRWKAVSELRHPNLIRILAVGRDAAEGREFVYAVEEFAEENLAQIVPERALTAEEARGMLGPVLGALAYAHGKGLVHGRLRPANILAAGDQVKVSSDSLRAAGEVPKTVSKYDAPEVAANGISTASDVWALGITLVEVLTQHVPAWDAARMSGPEVESGVPEPFRGIAGRCLEVDPGKRCAVPEIVERLEGKRAATTEAPPAAMAARQQRRAKWPVLAAAVVIGLAIYMTMRPQAEKAPAEGETPIVPVAPAPESRAQSSEAQPAPARTSGAAGTAGAEKTAAKDEVIERVMPQVSASARRTIQGKIKVRVRVKVDAAGNVTEATLKDAGPSQYFARVALEAARRWKFAAAEDESRAWTLLFAYTRARTDASAARGR